MKQIDITDIAADIDTFRLYIRANQHSTIECVSFLPTGKVSIVDKGRLEDLNNEIGRLGGLVDANSKVLTRLEEAIGAFPTVAAIEERRRYVNESILRTRDLLRHDVAELVKRVPGIDPGSPYSHPEGARLKDEADTKLASMHPELAALSEQLDIAQAILQEFQPSGLEPMPASTAPAMISREKVSGFGV